MVLRAILQAQRTIAELCLRGKILLNCNLIVLRLNLDYDSLTIQFMRIPDFLQEKSQGRFLRTNNAIYL